MFQFLISPNNSGTTVISQYAAARYGFYLPPFGNNEGQMAPEVRKMMRAAPWDSEADIDWRQVHECWLRLLEKSGRTVFWEASPPNLIRVRAIRREFGEQASFIFSMADPFSHLGSSCFNYERVIDKRALRRCVGAFLKKAVRQKANIEELGTGTNVISYESFCESPSSLDRAISHPVQNERPSIAGKGSTRISTIQNLNLRNAAFFTPEEFGFLAEALAEQAELIAWHGYELPARLEDYAWFQPDSEQLTQGRKRRRDWELGVRGAPAKSAQKLEKLVHRGIDEIRGALPFKGH